MKQLVWVCTIITVLVFGLQAQAPPPPPPPLIYSAPVPSQLKEFVDTEYKFKVSFPGTPTKNRNLGGEVGEVSSRVFGKGSNSSVAVLVFPRDMSSHKTDLYDSYKKDIAELSIGGTRASSRKSIVTFDRKITKDGIEGREFGYESDMHFTRVAVFVKGNLFFEVKIDVTNWHILTQHYPEVVKEFNREADRFIASFVFAE